MRGSRAGFTGERACPLGCGGRPAGIPDSFSRASRVRRRDADTPGTAFLQAPRRDITKRLSPYVIAADFFTGSFTERTCLDGDKPALRNGEPKTFALRGGPLVIFPLERGKYRLVGRRARIWANRRRIAGNGGRTSCPRHIPAMSNRTWTGDAISLKGPHPGDGSGTGPDGSGRRPIFFSPSPGGTAGAIFGKIPDAGFPRGLGVEQKFRCSQRVDTYRRTSRRQLLCI